MSIVLKMLTYIHVWNIDKNSDKLLTKTCSLIIPFFIYNMYHVLTWEC